MAQTTTTVATVAVQTFHNGTQTTKTRAVPAGFDSVTVLVNCTTGNPSAPFTGFNDPFDATSMSIVFGINWSWDGGATFPGSTQGEQLGSPTGKWGTNKQGAPVMTPEVTLGMPSVGGVFPNAYQAYMTVAGGPITFGLTVNETTG